MSGGSYNYIFATMENELEGRMYDLELNEMVKDFANVLHDLEWFVSGDYSESTYRKTAKEFKDKWFGDGTMRKDRLKKLIDNRIEQMRDELYKEAGIKSYEDEE